jgi:hypothetical protein
MTLTEIFGAKLAINLWRVSRSGVSPGGARCSDRSGLSVDALLDDGQGCATTGDGEVGRGPEVSAHAGAETGTGEFAPDRVGGAALETLGQHGYREDRRVGDQQMDGVGLAVELDQFGVEVGADAAHGVLGEGEHGVGEQFSPVFGYEDEVGVSVDAVAVAVIGRGCQWPPLRLCCG